MTEKQMYLILALFLVTMDVFVAVRTIRSDRQNVIFFGLAALGCAAMELFYTAGLFAREEFYLKLFMGAFYAAVPISLALLMMHFLEYTGAGRSAFRSVLVGGMWVLTLADLVLELTNPFTDAVMGFARSETNSFGYDFAPTLLYEIHLALCYAIIAGILVYIGYRVVQTSRVYRRKYYAIIFGLLVAVAVNGVCLHFQNEGLLDYSQASYSLLAVILYWDIFHNSERGLQTLSHQVIIDELVHPAILFGENNMLAACNRAAKALLPAWREGMPYSLHRFLKERALDPAIEQETENRTFQWENEQNGVLTTYRVDSCVIRDEREKIIGRMLVFTDNTLGVDLLTGFRSRQAFEREALAGQESFQGATLAILDINRLSEINRIYGSNEGDSCLRFLADSIRKNCSRDASYVRLEDANLLVLQKHVTDAEMRQCVERIRSECSARPEGKVSFDLQSAVMEVGGGKDALKQALASAMFSMRSRKLMDRSSAHTSLLDSIRQMLQEADPTTEAHVARTRVLGEQLGRRLNLTDLQLSNLSLLCLLHDIGKLGIPAELLNKPGALTKYEWEIMRSHVSRGYRIAAASPELAPIADHILHHHEAWDGSGYPDGLSRESIPLLSRIISVVDTYDAMVNDRPYRRALPEAEARAELRRVAGTQLDPHLVSEFLQMLEENAPLETEPEKKAPAASPEAEPEESRFVAPVTTAEFLMDPDGRILSSDKSFEEITGYSPKDIESYGLCFADLLFPEEKAAYERAFRQQMGAKAYAIIEHRMRRKDGSYRFVITSVATRYLSERRNAKYSVRLIDSSDSIALQRERGKAKESLQRQQESWETQLRRDPLTGALNHRCFFNDAEEALMTEKRPMLLAVLDVDRFKQYNDTYGHPEGDRLLMVIAGALQRAAGENGFAGRIGGDEFAVLLYLPEDAASAEPAVKALFEAVCSVTEAWENSATISLGAVLLSNGTLSFNEAYRAADAALYESKRKGRRAYTLAGTDPASAQNTGR